MKEFNDSVLVVKRNLSEAMFAVDLANKVKQNSGFLYPNKRMLQKGKVLFFIGIDDYISSIV